MSARSTSSLSVSSMAPSNLTMVNQFSGYIVIVDISGYTEFVKMHRTALAHAEQIITDLSVALGKGTAPPQDTDLVSIPFVQLDDVISKLQRS